LPIESKLHVQIARSDREIDRLARILEIERQRAEQTKIKAAKLEEQAMRSLQIAEQAKREKEI
jgi:hypothetical protein